MAKKVEKQRRHDLRTRTLMAMPNQKSIMDEAANKFSWAEARLKLGPTLHALICDLWEKGYCNTGQYLECLARMEQKQLAAGNIKGTMADDKEFLYELIDHFKNAEDYERSKDCTTYKAAFKKYYEALKLVDEHNIDNKYDWLYEEVFKIISNIFIQPRNDPDAANEMIARANFYYAHYLILKYPLSQYAVILLSESVKLSCGENWCPDIGLNFLHRYKNTNNIVDVIRFEPCINLYVLATRKLIELYLDCFEHILSVDLEKAQYLSNELLKLYDSRHGIWTYIYVLIAKAEYLIEVKDYDEALMVLHGISTQYFIASKEISMLYCKRYLLLGMCYRCISSNINSMTKSYQNFLLSLKLARKYDLRYLEAETYLNIGQLFSSEAANQFVKAQHSYHLARKIYESIGDSNNCKKVEFLLARLRGDSIFPAFIRLLKYENRPCATFHLRRWKNLALPFFEYMPQIDDDDNCESVMCLIDEMKYDIDGAKAASEYFKK